MAGIFLYKLIQGNPYSVSGAVTGDSGTLHGDVIQGVTYAWTVLNSGVLTAVGTLGNGIELNAGGAVTNSQSGLISGAGEGVGIHIDFGAVVANDGTVTGFTGVEATFGTVTNQGTIKGIGQLSTGISMNTGVVQNATSGVISADYRGVVISAGTAGGGTVIGTISATAANGIGVFVSNTVTNGAPGYYGGHNAVISGGLEGVNVAGSGTLANYGTITGSYAAVASPGSRITNAAGGSYPVTPTGFFSAPPPILRPAQGR